MSKFWRRTPLKPPVGGKPAPIAIAPVLSASARRRLRLRREIDGLKQEVEELKHFLVEINPIKV